MKVWIVTLWFVAALGILVAWQELKNKVYPDQIVMKRLGQVTVEIGVMRE